MRSLKDLVDKLSSIDGRGYKAYHAIKGSYRSAHLVLNIDHVQGDPFAEPSRLRVVIPPDSADFPGWAVKTAERRVTTADFLNRRLFVACSNASRSRGTGKSGQLQVLRPGQQILARTSLTVRPDGTVEARFRAGLPATGRRVLGRQATQLLTEVIPTVMDQSLFFPTIDASALRQHIDTVENAQALRAQLAPLGLVAFVANGSVLPRRSGIDDRPLQNPAPTHFGSPPSLEVTLQTPHAGAISGLGIRRGVTLIVGGGYHGKSTLLTAIEKGVYDHVPGDGRERVVTLPDAAKVRAEDGRAITATDISNFIADLPTGQDTSAFHTTNASGSTSQAAAIIESLEADATCLLLDEDTSATNFMVRDNRMRRLIPDALEPITPLVDRVRQLADQLNVSTILVAGGTGDFFDVADTVIAMQAYMPRDLTDSAAEICQRMPEPRPGVDRPWHPIRPRTLLRGTLNPSHRKKSRQIKTRSTQHAQYGVDEVDLTAMEQLVETAQARAVAESLAWAHENLLDQDRPLGELVTAVTRTISADGLDAVQHQPTGDLAAFRTLELAAFLSRHRNLRAK